MFQMTDCTAATYERISRFTRLQCLGISQENLRLGRFILASWQPNTMDDKPPHDFYWCRRFLKWFM